MEPRSKKWHNFTCSGGGVIKLLRSWSLFFDMKGQLLFFRFLEFGFIVGGLGQFSALEAHFGRAPNITFGTVLEPGSKKWPNFTFNGGGCQAFEKWDFVFRYTRPIPIFWIFEIRIHCR